RRERLQRDRQPRPVAPRLRPALEDHVLDGIEALVRLRWLLLPRLRPERARREARRIVLAAQKRFWFQQRSVLLEHAFDGVALRLGERRLQPETAHARSVPACRPQDRLPAGARQVSVVEHDPPRAGGEPGFERSGDAGERPAALVAVEARVALSGKVLRQRGLAGAGESG